MRYVNSQTSKQSDKQHKGIIDNIELYHTKQTMSCTTAVASQEDQPLIRNELQQLIILNSVAISDLQLNHIPSLKISTGSG